LFLITRFRRSPAQEQTVTQDNRTTKSAVRRVAGWALTALAALLVFLALIVPDQVTRLTPGSFVPGAFVRIPVEALAGIAVLLVLPPRARRPVAVVFGAVLGILTILKIIDIGFFAVLARQFDPVLDWPLFADGYRFAKDSFGRGAALGAVLAAVVLAAAVLVLMTLAVRRLARLALGHPAATTRGAAAAGIAWVACAALGTHFVAAVPVASDTAAALARDTVLKVPAALQDQRAFAAEAAVDAFRDTPDNQLLTALRGKDVVVSFVESYGRSAVEDPELTPQIDAALAAGTDRLKAAGYASRSAFLTSPTAGGGSWLAHSTFLSGLWINNEQRYRRLVSGDRLTLTHAFGRADWRTVGVEPGVTYAWPEASFYGYDKVYDSHTLGYRGPVFGWSTMPDQYVLEAFARSEYTAPHRAPLLAEITLTSSHTPWAPVPHLLDWKDVGDGAGYGPMAAAGESAASLWRDPARVRSEYARSIAYSLDSLTSYVQTYGNDNLVMIFLGDHQPSPIITGENASRDVPVTIVAHDEALLNRISGWGWQDGLKPGPQAPVWRMDAFRDRFLTAFGPQGSPH
jgi:hypothetical protein